VPFRHDRGASEKRILWAVAGRYTRWGGPRLSVQGEPLIVLAFGDFGDFGVSFVATVAGRYTRWGDIGLAVQGEP
jgi:hypothetical protein